MLCNTNTSKKTEAKVLVNVFLTENQANALNDAWRIEGYLNRSQFLRDIILERVESVNGRTENGLSV